MVQLIDTWGSDNLIAQVAKLSHGNKSKKNTEEMIDMLMRLGHDSVFEFAGATLKVTTSIVVQRQWMRHRHASYLEKSLRYVKNNEVTFGFDPARFKTEGFYNAAFDTAKHAFDIYKNLLDNGVPAEVARSVLPMGMLTEFYVSANLRSWFNFLKLRLSTHAQYEIREEAKQVYELLSEKFPITMKKWKEYNDINTR